MKRDEFLKQLRRELDGIATTEIEDIIRDQEELIRDAVSAGRNEESVITSLGDPKELARTLRAQAKLEQVSESNSLSKQLRGVFGAVGALLVLAPFNLIFVLGPFLALCGITFGGWCVAIALFFVALIALLIFLFKIVFISAGVFTHLSVLFGVLGSIGATLLICAGMYYVTKFLVQITVSYLKWNLNFIKKQAA